ncbi:hypothetical protein [Salinivibrio sp. IB282]|nr:hypothetical protein [Salinivibrio sp. IB282]
MLLHITNNDINHTLMSFPARSQSMNDVGLVSDYHATFLHWVDVQTG